MGNGKLMGISGILEHCSNLEVLEKRLDAKDYKELVFFAKDLSKWQKIMESQFGPAIKPSGKEPTADQMQVTLNYGGIYRHQTLFLRKDDNERLIAMFWPWEDKVHITLKIALYK